MPPKRKSTGGASTTPPKKAKASNDLELDEELRQSIERATQDSLREAVLELCKHVSDAGKIISPLLVASPPVVAQPKKAKAPKDLSLDIPSHEKILKALYRDLKRAVKEDWHDGYYEHMEIQSKIVNVLLNWLGEVFRNAIFPGERLNEAFKAMVIINEWILKERGNEFGVRVDWREGEAGDTVNDLEGKQVYKGLPERIQDKMWRDMAIKAIVVKDQPVLDAIMTHCYKPATERSKAQFGDDDASKLFRIEVENLAQFHADKEKARDIEQQMRELSGLPPYSEAELKELERDENCNEDGYPIEDEWYADDAEMQKARSEFRSYSKYSRLLWPRNVIV